MTRYLVIRAHDDGRREPVGVSTYMTTAVTAGILREIADRRAGTFTTAYHAEPIEDLDDVPTQSDHRAA